MAERRGILSSVLSELTAVSGAALGVLHSRLNDGPPRALLYGGYGADARMLVHGRALQDPAPRPATAAQPAWRNAVALLQRADAMGVPHAVVRVRSGAATREFMADDEGFFSGWMDARGADRVDAQWVRVVGELVSNGAPDAVGDAGDARVWLPLHAPELLVISDVDDTVLQSHATRFLTAIRTVLFENARTRLPFPGVAAFYRALRDGVSGTAQRPLFYVSSSPWNLHDVIHEFLDVQQIPSGPIILRDVDLGLGVLDRRHHHTHKREVIRRILSTYATAGAVLVGDSGQEDPEIYRDVVSDFPDRIRAIYIRNVTQTADRSDAIARLAAEVHAAGSTLVLADDTLAAARHAADHGLIAPERLGEVERDMQADEGRAGDRRAAGAPAPPTPTTVVE